MKKRLRLVLFVMLAMTASAFGTTRAETGYSPKALRVRAYGSAAALLNKLNFSIHVRTGPPIFPRQN